MPTLLLRIAGVMQSWGVSSKFDNRRTEREPSKSGIIGMVAAALGRTRDDPIADLNNLRYGVRIDQIGPAEDDFQIAQRNKVDSFVTRRSYLLDSIFLIGLEGDRELIEAIDKAIRNPHYPLFLGRRSCPPSGRVTLGIRETGLIESLKLEPWLASEWYKKKQKNDVRLEIVSDSDNGALVRDSPISFSQNRRLFGFRNVSHTINGCTIHIDNRETDTDLDPFSVAGGR